VVLWRITQQGTLTRKQIISLVITKAPPAKVIFERRLLFDLQRFFEQSLSSSPFLHNENKFAAEVATAPPILEAIHSIHSTPPWQHLTALTGAIYEFLLGPKLLARVAFPPHGAAVVQVSPDEISAALFECQWIAQRVLSDEKGTEALRKRVEEILQADKDLLNYSKRYRSSSEKTIAVIIVCRHLCSCGAATEAAELLALSPQQVFRRFNNKGQHRQFREARLEEQKKSSCPCHATKARSYH
jgi:hypothetical protein